MARRTPAAPTEPSVPTEPTEVLIVGDWLVDEHWVVGQHRSPSSSRTGQRHSRALHGMDCSVRSLCGAGQVATILYEAGAVGGEKLFHVIGVGLWNASDDAELCKMLHPKNNVGRTLFRLSPDPTPNYEPVTAQLHNLLRADWGSGAELPSQDALDVSTNRVIRIYARTGDHVQLIERIDWELELSEMKREQIEQRIDGQLESHLAHLKRHHNKLRHIVIKDLGKGVVSGPLVRELKEQFPDALWYVSSKARSPEWFKDVKTRSQHWFSDLPAANVRLLLIPQQAVAMNDGQTSPWVVSGSHPSRDALEAIENLSAKYSNARIIVLPQGLSLLTKGRTRGSVDERVIVQSDVGSLEAQQFVPMASVLFPTLVAYRIALDNAEESFIDEVKEALDFTRNWMVREGERLKREDWVPRDEQRLNLRSEIGTGRIVRPVFGDWQDWPWDSESQQWKDALTDCGIIWNGGQPEFHLWRAMTEVPGYVSCVRSKREVLRTLLKHGRDFASRRPRRAKSFMVIDAPGSGKSFLIKRLAKALGMRPLTFNITQMLTRTDLLHCFDTIATSQAQDPEEPMLVFIDEINSKLDGEHVYDSFLAPLEDGVYVRSGNTFHIAPCLWIFAGTEAPVPREEGKPHDKSDKGSDFESRLTLPPLVLISEDADKNELRMEKVYVGVASLRAEFADVRHVSEKVLKAFRFLHPNTGPRDIRHFVKQFQHIQFARVRWTNLPPDWHTLFSEDLAIDDEQLKQWHELKEGTFVELKSESGTEPTESRR